MDLDKFVAWLKSSRYTGDPTIDALCALVEKYETTTAPAAPAAPAKAKAAGSRTKNA